MASGGAKEGSTIKVYRLQLIPMSRAYNFENPQVLASDVAMKEEEGEEHVVSEEENSMGEKSLPIENKPIEEKNTSR